VKQHTLDQMKQQMLQMVHEEIALEQLNQKARRMHIELSEVRQDFYSLVTLAMVDELAGQSVDDPNLLDEGLWSKLKYGLGKLGSLEKGGKLFGGKKAKAEAYAQKIVPALQSASGKVVQDLLAKLKEEYPGFPNMEENVEHLGALMQIGAAYDSVVAAVEAGEMEAVAANELIKALRDVVEYYRDYELADVYKHFKEGAETEEVLSEVNLNRLIRLVQTQKMSPMDAIRRIEKSGPLRGRSKRAAMDQIKTIGKNLYGPGGTAAAGGGTAAGAASAGGAGGAAGGAGGAAGGAGGGAAGAAPNLGQSMQPALGQSMQPGMASVKTVGTGATNLGAGATAAYWASVLGIAAVASGAAIAALRAKGRKSSRTQQMNALLDEFELMDVSQTPTLAQAAGQDASGEGEGEGEGGGAERGDIYVFRGKGDLDKGVGIQSQLAKAGMQGPEMSAMLKGLRADLSAAGFNVLEEAKRETISLQNTLAAVDKIKDPKHKEAAKNILVKMLRAHSIRLDPESSRSLAPGGGGSPEDAQKPLGGGEDPQKPLGGSEETSNGVTPAAAAEKKCDPGYTRNSAGACVPFGTPDSGAGKKKKEADYQPELALGRHENLSREDKALLENWHKLAGILKG